MTTQFFHKKCKALVVTDCTGMFKITCITVGTTRTQLRPSSVEINPNVEQTTPRFVCSGCGESIKDLNNIITTCNSCGAVESVYDLERVFDSGMIICTKCKEKTYKDKSSRTLAKIMSTISLG